MVNSGSRSSEILSRAISSLSLFGMTVCFWSTAVMVVPSPVAAVDHYYIRSDGSIDPATAPITWDGQQYLLAEDISAQISVEAGGIVFDGAGHTNTGSHSYGEGGFLLNAVDHVTIRNITLRSFGWGVYLGWSADMCTISDVTFMDNDWGIYASGYSYTQPYSASYNSVIGCKFIDNLGGMGFYYSSCSNTISDNTLIGNSGSSLSFGWWSSVNLVVDNYIANNGIGMYLDQSHDNAIYHNTFMNNTNQIYWQVEETSVWTDSYPSGGNYWDDYDGDDLKSGQNQDQDCSDGIGDTPYIITTTQADPYPLMEPYRNNTAPVALFTIDPPNGDITTNFSFDASSSYDFEDNGSELGVRWDWDGDGVWDTGRSVEKVAQHVFSTPGVYSVSVEVTDTHNRTDISTLDVVVSDIEIPELGMVAFAVAVFMAVVVFAMRTRR